MTVSQHFRLLTRLRGFHLAGADGTAGGQHTLLSDVFLSPGGGDLGETTVLLQNGHYDLDAAI